MQTNLGIFAILLNCYVPKSVPPSVIKGLLSIILSKQLKNNDKTKRNNGQSDKVPGILWSWLCIHLPLSASFSPPFFCLLNFSSVHLCTASLRGSVTCMCHCWTDCMSTTPLNSPVASSSVRTTAPMKLSSSRCEPSTLPCVEPVGTEAEKVEGRRNTRVKRWWEEGVGVK